MYRVNVYVNDSGKIDIQGQAYSCRSDRVFDVHTYAADLESALQYLDDLRNNCDCEFSITIHRST
jgi:hypothetical protein